MISLGDHCSGSLSSAHFSLWWSLGDVEYVGSGVVWPCWWREESVDPCSITLVLDGSGQSASLHYWNVAGLAPSELPLQLCWWWLPPLPWNLLFLSSVALLCGLSFPLPPAESLPHALAGLVGLAPTFEVGSHLVLAPAGPTAGLLAHSIMLECKE